MRVPSMTGLPIMILGSVMIRGRFVMSRVPWSGYHDRFSTEARQGLSPCKKGMGSKRRRHASLRARSMNSGRRAFFQSGMAAIFFCFRSTSAWRCM